MPRLRRPVTFGISVFSDPISESHRDEKKVEKSLFLPEVRSHL